METPFCCCFIFFIFFLFLYFTFYIHNSHIAIMNIHMHRIYNRLITKFVYAFLFFLSLSFRSLFLFVVVVYPFCVFSFCWNYRIQLVIHKHFTTNTITQFALSRFDCCCCFSFVVAFFSFLLFVFCCFCFVCIQLLMSAVLALLLFCFSFVYTPISALNYKSLNYFNMYLDWIRLLQLPARCPPPRSICRAYSADTARAIQLLVQRILLQPPSTSSSTDWTRSHAGTHTHT